MSEEQQEPPLTRSQSGQAVCDLEAIDFPTDRITLKHIRQLNPGLFADLMGEVDFDSIDAFTAHKYERVLAENAFAQALGLEPPHKDFERFEPLESLDSDYQRYGLSTGIHQTRELIRSFESEAARQARRFQGRTAGGK